MTYLVTQRGDTFERTIVWENYNAEVIDLTDYTINLTVVINGVPEVYTEGDGLTVTAGAGQIDIAIEADVTAEWGTTGRWYLTATSDVDAITTIDHGILRVE